MADILDEAASVVADAIATHTAGQRAEALERIGELLDQYPGGGVMVIVTGAGGRGQELQFMTNTGAQAAIYIMEVVAAHLMAGQYGGA